MKILLTGAAGYLGGAVANEASRRGHETFCLDAKPYPWSTDRGFRLSPGPKAYVQQDVCQVAYFDFWDVDAVIHLAALVGEAICDAVGEDEAMRVNVGGTERLLALGKPLVYSSTCSNYGRQDGLVNECSPRVPIGLYARSKCAAEDLVLVAKQTVLRFGTLTGRAPRTRTDLIPNEWAVQAALGEDLEVYEPDAWRPFCHVQTAAEVLVAVAERAAAQALPGAFQLNVVEENRTKGALAGALAEQFGVKVKTVPKGDARSYQVSCAKFVEWSPIFLPVHRGTLRGAREVYEWARQNPEGAASPELRNV